MTPLRALALTALFLAAVPSEGLAHQGLVHEGCMVGQIFTAGDITVSGAFTRAMLPGAQSAGGYLTIVNAGAEPDTLTGASSEAAGKIEIHTMSVVDDVMKMSALTNGLELPAGGTVTLDTKTYHLMMADIGADFIEGECVEITLHFAKAGDLNVVLNIGGIAAIVPPADGHNMHDMPEMQHDMSSMEGM